MMAPVTAPGTGLVFSASMYSRRFTCRLAGKPLEGLASSRRKSTQPMAFVTAVKDWPAGALVLTLSVNAVVTVMRFRFVMNNCARDGDADARSRKTNNAREPQYMALLT